MKTSFKLCIPFWAFKGSQKNILEHGSKPLFPIICTYHINTYHINKYQSAVWIPSCFANLTQMTCLCKKIFPKQKRTQHHWIEISFQLHVSNCSIFRVLYGIQTILTTQFCLKLVSLHLYQSPFNDGRMAETKSPL